MTKKILIVDDDPNIQELLLVNLKSEGYEVLSACNGREGIEKTESEKPGLVILDVMMPEIDGWEVCKTIKDQYDSDDPAAYSPKILMLTAKGTEKDKLIGKHVLNVDEYMTKPFDLKQLLETVKRLLNG
jgi:DNA-binding response OmpR family regulator